ncbi:hypothetical protein N5C72_19055 [Achromobacter mucicolens]|uniref:SpoVT-AbrB domain-containing protein n=1 Tax=Achromobacter mucicolens TaxID=1389922 RepID=A0ABD4YYE8_9BURK|nr:hypothetical protein [Achromobacter mucicolens]MDG9971492.1 hypothetical protein [Achromobacter mucicolens]MDH1180188.1 hypothetical protein [Achromobacter mucicolens]
MEPRLLHNDVSHGFSVRLPERVFADLSLEGRVRFALAMRDELLVAVLGGRHVWGGLKPRSCRMARGSGG